MDDARQVLTARQMAAFIRDCAIPFWNSFYLDIPVHSEQTVQRLFAARVRLIEKHISFAFVGEKLKASYSETGRP